MKLEDLGEINLRYTSVEIVDSESGGRVYGAMEGRVSGERLSGQLRLTNFAPRLPDGTNRPTLRGLLVTDDGARCSVELDGVAAIRESDSTRTFIEAVRFETGDERYLWLNSLLAIFEGVLDNLAVGGVARGRLYECKVTIA
jgi:hypothetical protein